MSRKPINAGDEKTIFTAQSNVPSTTNSTANINKGAANQSQNGGYHPTANNHQYTANQNTYRSNQNAAAAGSVSHRQISPTRSAESSSNVNGPKITKRELWWKEPSPSQVKILTNGKPTEQHVTARVDHKNEAYSPASSTGKQIESRKLEWNSRSG
jgi:hypothetical protein